MKINEALVTCLCKRLVLIPRPASQIQRSQIYLRRPVTGQSCVTNGQWWSMMVSDSQRWSMSETLWESLTVSSCIQLRLQASSWSQNVTSTTWHWHVQTPFGHIAPWCNCPSLVARRPHSHFWPCHASRGPFQPRHDSTPRWLFLHCFCSWVKKKDQSSLPSHTVLTYCKMLDASCTLHQTSEHGRSKFEPIHVLWSSVRSRGLGSAQFHKSYAKLRQATPSYAKLRQALVL